MIESYAHSTKISKETLKFFLAIPSEVFRGDIVKVTSIFFNSLDT